MKMFAQYSLYHYVQIQYHYVQIAEMQICKFTYGLGPHAYLFPLFSPWVDENNASQL